MAKYVSPRVLGSVFNNDQFFAANLSSTLSNISSSQLSTTNANIQSLNIIAGTDSLTLQDSLFQQHGNDLSISTDDGFTLHLNKDKPTSGDLNINENSRNSNVNIVNGNLNIQNGYLNMGKTGTIILNGADINAVMVGNTYQLSLHADTLANHGSTIVSHAVGIQSAADVGAVNSNQIVQIQQSYAPIDAPILTTSLTLPPIVIANGSNLTDVQFSFLSNLSQDVQTAINSLSASLSSVTSNQLTDEANISSLQSSVATIQTKQTQDESNIVSLQSSVATISSKQTQDESNIASIQTNLGIDEANISSLQSAVQTKANINSPTFSGEPRVPTANPISNNTVIANTQYVDLAIASLVGTSPSLLNTLQEIDAAINNDPSFATTVGNQIALKANINNPSFTTGISTPAINLNGNDLQTSLNGFALNSQLSNYLLSSTASSTYALISSLSNYVTSSALVTTLSSYVTSSSLATTLSSYALSSTLNLFVCSSKQFVRFFNHRKCKFNLPNNCWHEFIFNNSKRICNIPNN
jgi:hypothetical protein